MADIFGYKKTAKGLGDINSPSMVYVSISGDKLRLAQSASVTYQRTVTPVYELGSESVWMSGGHSNGTVQISRAVGEVGMLRPFSQGDPCKAVTIILGKGDGACGLDPGTITATGALLTSVGVEVSVQGVTITDSANYTCGAVKAS